VIRFFAYPAAIRRPNNDKPETPPDPSWTPDKALTNVKLETPPGPRPYQGLVHLAGAVPAPTPGRCRTRTPPKGIENPSR
jgi:hypothetical protein